MTLTVISPGIQCKAHWRHTGLDGYVFVRTIRGVKYWVAVLECPCGTVRTTKYVPGTGQKVGTHQYWRPADTDYPDDLTQEECLRLWLESHLSSD